MTQRQIDVIQQDEPIEENRHTESHLQAQLDEELLRRDTIWKQKSRELWVKDGDRNSKFFHLSTSIRRRKNQICAIKDGNSDWIHRYPDIGEYFLRNLKDLYKFASPDFLEELEGLFERE